MKIMASQCHTHNSPSAEGLLSLGGCEADRHWQYVGAIPQLCSPQGKAANNTTHHPLPEEEAQVSTARLTQGHGLRGRFTSLSKLALQTRQLIDTHEAILFDVLSLPTESWICGRRDD